MWLVAGALAAPPEVDALVRAALDREPMLAAAAARARQERASTPIGAAPMDPMVAVTLMGSGPDMAAADLMISQTFVPPGSLAAARAASDARADAAGARALGAALGLEAEVREAAAMLAGAEARLDALAAARASAVASTDARVARSGAGMADNGEVAMAAMALAEIDGRAEIARSDAAIARAMLVRLCGGAPEHLALAPPPARLPSRGDPPEIAAMEAMRRMAEADAAMARAERAPDLTVSAGWSFRPPSMWGDMATLGVSTSLPVFSARKQGPRVAAATLATTAADLDRDAARLDVDRELSASAASFEALTRRLADARRAAAAARASVDGARSAWSAGMGDLGPVLEAEGRVAEIAEMEAMIRSDALIAEARYAAVAGVSLVSE